MDNQFNIDRNLETIYHFIEQNSASVYVFPESCLTGYTLKREHLLTIELDDPRLLALCNYCSERAINIFIGANIIINDKFYIAYLHIHEQIDYYCKTHLGLSEAQLFNPGNQLKLFDANVKMGVCLCIESHFPELALTLRRRGAACLLMPFASPAACGERAELWAKYLPARAYDNAMYVLATNLTGQCGGINYNGGMLALDYRGNVMAEYYGSSQHAITIKLDIAALENRRINFKTDYINRRRPELYEED